MNIEKLVRDLTISTYTIDILASWFIESICLLTAHILVFIESQIEIVGLFCLSVDIL